jgi:hypothetical protein
MSQPNPDREEQMPITAPEITSQPAYRVDSSEDEVVVRFRRGGLSDEQILRFLALVDLDAVRQESQLTEEDAMALGEEINHAVWEQASHRVGSAGNARERALDVIRQLPPEASVEEMMEKLYFLSKVERGLRQIDAGQVVSHEEAKRRFGR